MNNAIRKEITAPSAPFSTNDSTTHLSYLYHFVISSIRGDWNFSVTESKHVTSHSSLNFVIDQNSNNKYVYTMRKSSNGRRKRKKDEMIIYPQIIFSIKFHYAIFYITNINIFSINMYNPSTHNRI